MKLTVATTVRGLCSWEGLKLSTSCKVSLVCHFLPLNLCKAVELYGVNLDSVVVVGGVGGRGILVCQVTHQILQ